jgi:hypothetical protein
MKRFIGKNEKSKLIGLWQHGINGNIVLLLVLWDFN